jgi:hypothetical protein
MHEGNHAIPCSLVYLDQPLFLKFKIGEISPKNEFQNSKTKWFCTLFSCQRWGKNKKPFINCKKLYLLESKRIRTSEEARLWLPFDKSTIQNQWFSFHVFTQCGFYVFPFMIMCVVYQQKIFSSFIQRSFIIVNFPLATRLWRFFIYTLHHCFIFSLYTTNLGGHLVVEVEPKWVIMFKYHIQKTFMPNINFSSIIPIQMSTQFQHPSC